MPTQATYDDVTLMLRLYELRREEKLRAARAFMTGAFKAATLEELNALCPAGSETHTQLRMAISYWEMVASFITSGVLNAELFFQSGGELTYTFERLRHLVGPMRTGMNIPGFLSETEKVADMFLAWLERQGAGAAAAFQQRARGGM